MRHPIPSKLLLFIAAYCLLVCKAAETATQSTFRTNNLDFLDASTLDFYLEYPPAQQQDFDIAVLYYATRDKNSRDLASMWAQIAQILQAGTQDSRLIMGLFDCEADAQHVEVCNKAGITHYPTLEFVTLSGYSFGGKLKHVTKFGGNWQYGDSILDWLNAMSGLSKWHRAGWGKRLRSFFFKTPNQKKAELPLGIPSATRGSASSSSSSGSGAAVSSAALTKAEKEAEEYMELSVRGARMLQAVLFPETSAISVDNPALLMSHDGVNFTDMFAELKSTKVWDSALPQHQVLQACVLDLALDYCQRITNKVTNDFLVYYGGLPASEQAEMEKNISKVEAQLDTMINDAEPFCAVLETCVLESSTSEECHPASCPFKDKSACRYLTSCLSESIQEDYATALGVVLPSADSIVEAERKEKESSSASSKKKSMWGM
jgi:hypothetical protein